MAPDPDLTMYLNGELVPHSHGMAAMRQEERFVSAGGFYDAERTFNGRVFKLREHLSRLYRGLEHAGIDAGMTLEEMEATTLAQGGEFSIRQLVSNASGELAEGQPAVNVIVYCQAIDFAEFALGYGQGIRIVTPATYRVPGQAGPDEAKRGAQKTFPLTMDSEGNVTECTGANFMFVRDGRVKLPNRRSVLPGVSMQTALELCEELGIGVDEDDYSVHDLYAGQEAFVTSVSR